MFTGQKQVKKTYQPIFHIATGFSEKDVFKLVEYSRDLHLYVPANYCDFNANDYNAVILLCSCGVNLPEEWVLRDVFEDCNLTIQQGNQLKLFAAL